MSGGATDAERSDWSVLDLLPDATFVVSRDARILHSNPAATRLLEATQPLPGSPAAQWLRLVDDTEADWWQVARPLEADPRLLPRIPEQHLRLLYARRAPRPVTLTGRRVPGADGRCALLVLSVRRAERRQRVDAARSDLVSTVSHELRSPLTSVKGFTKTLLAKWERFSDEQKRQMLATVNEDADRVTRLLGELLDVSRIDAGRLALRRRMVDVADLVERRVTRLQFDDEGDRVHTRMPADLPLLYADPDKLAQVFANLIENAMKYGTGSIEVSAVAEPDVVRFVVTDHGEGIDAAHLRQIFTKFYRRAGERHTGTGLGLYITKGIVEAHGGRIWAESDPASGTRLSFTLPIGGLELAGITPRLRGALP